VIHKLDRDAITDWIDGCADVTKGREVIADLAQLNKPEAWVWCPEIAYGPERVTFPLFHDSFKPQAADATKLKGCAEVDLEEVKARLVAVVQEAEANDPKKLKKRIAELEEQAARPARTPSPAPDDRLVRNQQREIERLRAENHELSRRVCSDAGLFVSCFAA
jgi:hypothetical protein